MKTASEYQQMDKVVQTVVGCARCGCNHLGLVFNRLLNAGEYTHYATCPNTLQPVFLMFRDVEDEPKKQVKPMDSLIEVVDWRVSNEEVLKLDVRVTRDDGISLVKMRIVKDCVTQSDSLVIAN